MTVTPSIDPARLLEEQLHGRIPYGDAPNEGKFVLDPSPGQPRPF